MIAEWPILNWLGVLSCKLLLIRCGSLSNAADVSLAKPRQWPIKLQDDPDGIVVGTRPV